MSTKIRGPLAFAKASFALCVALSALLGLAAPEAAAQAGARGKPISRVLAPPKSLGVCSGPPKGLSIAPTSAAFPSVTQGGACASQSFTVTNVGSLPVSLSSTYASDNNVCDQSSTMSVTGCGAQSLAPGGSCSATVQFCANSNSCPGSRSGALYVYSDAPSSPLVASLTGTVVAATPPPVPAIVVSPPSYDFGNVLQGTASPPSATITVTSSGTAPVTVTGATTSAPFSITGNTCGSPMSPGQNCLVTVTYTPTIGVGFESGTLSLSSTGNPASVGLSGNGVAPPGLVLGGVNIGPVDQGSAPVVQAAVFSNFGTSSATIAAIAGPGAPFTWVGGTCTVGGTVAAGGSCTLNIEYTPPPPTTSDVFYSGTLVVTVGTTPYTSYLYGYSVPPAANVSVSPSPSFTFGDVPVGSSSSCTDFVFTNTDTTKTAVFEIPNTLSYTDFASCTPTASPQCSNFPFPDGYESLAPGASCAVGLQFSPTYGGTQYVTLYANDPFRYIQMGTVDIDGTGSGPVLDVTPSTYLSFGSQVVGTSAATQILSVTNTGTAPLTISSVSLPPSTDFPVTDNCAPYPRVLAVGGSCTLSVGFTPAALGYYYSSLSFISDAVSGYGYVYVDGDGVAVPTPSADFYPMTLSFGNVAFGTTSPVQSFSFANTGSAPMTISGITASGANAGDFAVSHGCPLSPSTLAPNTCCTVQVTFTPSVGGTTPAAESATINVATDASGSPHPVPVDGTSVPPPSISPATITFPDTVSGSASAAVPIAVKNTGASAITLGTLAVSGPFAFVPAGTTCAAGTVLSIGASCVVNVSFKPTVVGSLGGTMTVPYTGGVASPASFALVGNGLSPFFPGIAVSTDAVDFGDVVIGQGASRTVTVSSIGTGPLAVTQLVTFGSYFSAVTDCTASQDPGTSCTVSVSCRPDALGPLDGDLDIYHSATGGRKHVSLRCNGVPVPKPKIDVSLTAIGFGNQTLGTTSTGRQVLIRSVGTAPLVLGGTGTALPFSAGSNCPASMEPGTSCLATVQFSPARAGVQTGRLGIVSNDPERPTAGVDLSGTGCRPFSIQAARRGQNLCAP